MYKILSLDGGGSWSILQLLTLKERYQEEIPSLKGHEILKQFDMVIANSGGSIVLAALTENWTIDEALRLFNDRATREKIFSQNSYWETFWPVTLTKLFSLGPKYSAERKYAAFQDLFPTVDNIPMDELPAHIGNPELRLVVCTFDALNNRAKFFRSYAENSTRYESVPITKAIHGSSNAPVQYFDFPAKVKTDDLGIEYHLWDGALGGFNNPVVAGVIEAFRLGIPLDEVHVISLGTGNKLMSESQKDDFHELEIITEQERTNKFKFWKYGSQFQYFKEIVLNQAKTILFEPPDWANFVALMFLSKTNKDDVKDRFIRLSPIIHIDEHSDPSCANLLDKLFALDMDLTKDEDIETLKCCFEEWKAGRIQNQPIAFSIEKNNELVYQKGDKYFEDGMNKWKTKWGKEKSPVQV